LSADLPRFDQLLSIRHLLQACENTPGFKSYEKCHRTNFDQNIAENASLGKALVEAIDREWQQRTLLFVSRLHLKMPMNASDFTAASDCISAEALA